MIIIGTRLDVRGSPAVTVVDDMVLFYSPPIALVMLKDSPSGHDLPQGVLSALTSNVVNCCPSTRHFLTRGIYDRRQGPVPAMARCAKTRGPALLIDLNGFVTRIWLVRAKTCFGENMLHRKITKCSDFQMSC